MTLSTVDGRSFRSILHALFQPTHCVLQHALPLYPPLTPLPYLPLSVFALCDASRACCGLINFLIY